MQKYKVFLNEKSIVFTLNGKITLTKPTIKFLENSSKGRLNNWLDDIEFGAESETVLEHADINHLFQTFKGAFLIVNAAGGVVKRNNKLLFIYRNDKWDLPKGKIDDGETPEQAAIREVGEECGIEGHKIITPLPSTFHIYRSPYKETKGQWIFKETFWYEMEYSGEEEGFPQAEEGITKVRWFIPDELHEVLENTYGNLKQIIERYRD